MPPRRARWPLAAWCLLLGSLLLVAMTLAITWGSATITPASVWRIAAFQWQQALGLGDGGALPASPQHIQIVWQIRLPRVLLAALVGAGLAVVGTVMQAMVRNPLADPYLLGVSAGASTGAVIVLAFGAFGLPALHALNLAAFAGALLATLAVYFLAHRDGLILPTRLVLVGVAIGYVLSGATSLITLTAGQRDLAGTALRWTLGSLSGTRWDDLGVPALVMALTLIWLLLQARPLNALMTGEDTAMSLGVDTSRLRRQLFVLVSLLTGTMVAVSGTIGFVGLVVPHIGRMLAGVDHRRLLPVAALTGALFLVLVDLGARTLFSPQEIPVGVITALLGGPFFLIMLGRYTASADSRQRSPG